MKLRLIAEKRKKYTVDPEVQAEIAALAKKQAEEDPSINANWWDKLSDKQKEAKEAHDYNSWKRLQ